VIDVVAAAAEVMKMNPLDLARITTANGADFFGIEQSTI
jgi:hypothetical protein